MERYHTTRVSILGILRGVAEAQGNTNATCTPYEKEYIRKDGSRIPVLVGYVLLGEKREESVAFILDLSERKLAEAEQQKLVSLVENSSDFIGIASLEGQLLYINDAGQKLVGLASLEEVRQKVVLITSCPKTKPIFKNIYCRLYYQKGAGRENSAFGISKQVNQYQLITISSLLQTTTQVSQLP